jgi:hypothetical protein
MKLNSKGKLCNLTKNIFIDRAEKVSCELVNKREYILLAQVLLVIYFMFEIILPKVSHIEGLEGFYFFNDLQKKKGLSSVYDSVQYPYIGSKAAAA